MADFERPLGALVNPPLAPTPPLADIEDRARRHRTRRRAGVGGVAGVAAAALVAGLIALVPGDGDTTVHTASPAGGTAAGSGASLANGTAALDGKPLDTFEAGGVTWQLVLTATPGCVEVRNSPTMFVAGSLCWTGGPLQATSVTLQGTTYLFGLVDGSATAVRFGAGSGPSTGAELPLLAGTVSGAVSTSPNTTVGRPDNGLKIFGRILTGDVVSGSLVAATKDNPQAFTFTLDQLGVTNVHGRVSSVNGQDSAPPTAPPTTTAVRQTPTTIVATTIPAPVVTSPATTVPALLGIPKLITVTLGAQNLHKITFESATASGQRSLAVRFWAGVEPCTVLGKVDVVESADKVTVTLWAGTGNALVLCTALAQYFETIVPLSAPLGARAVVDGAA